MAGILFPSNVCPAGQKRTYDVEWDGLKPVKLTCLCDGVEQATVAVKLQSLIEGQAHAAEKLKK